MDPDSRKGEGYGVRTPPPGAGEAVPVGGSDELTLGGHYWMQDDSGDEVWRLAEVLERGEGGIVSIRVDGGGVTDIDPVSEILTFEQPSV